MNSKERLLDALRGGRPDRVPVFLRDLTLGLDLLDVSTPEICLYGPGGGYHAEKAAEAVIICQSRFGQDCVVGGIHDLGMDVEPLGGRTDFPERGVPRVVEPPFADKARLAAARIPLMDRDGRLPGVLKAYELVKQRIGREIAIAANVEGPITKASIYRGTEGLLSDFMLDPGFAADLVAFATEVSISHIKFLAEVGVDFVFVAAAVDGPVIVGPEIYMKYTIPNLGRMVSAARACGLGVVFHPHGRFTDDKFQPLVEAARAQGIIGFQFPENCDLGLAKRLWGSRMAILGGIDIATVLTPGPAKLIRAETRKCIEAAAPGGGYVFMPSCSLHRGDPLNHIDTMVKAVREFGRY